MMQDAIDFITEELQCQGIEIGKGDVGYSWETVKSYLES